MKLAILASGNGTNAQAIIEAVNEGRLDASVGVVLTNRPEAGVVARARDLGVPVEIVPSKGVKDRTEFDAMVIGALSAYDVDTIALAGWMRILSDLFLQTYRDRIVNLHPAILPSFKGGTGIADACEYGVKLAGCTVHLVSPVLDGGPIIIQAAVPVDGGMEKTESRIHEMEHLILPQALQWLSEDRIRVDGRVTRLLPPAVPVTKVSEVDGCLVWPPLEKR